MPFRFVHKLFHSCAPTGDTYTRGGEKLRNDKHIHTHIHTHYSSTARRHYTKTRQMLFAAESDTEDPHGNHTDKKTPHPGQESQERVPRGSMGAGKLPPGMPSSSMGMGRSPGPKSWVMRRCLRDCTGTRRANSPLGRRTSRSSAGPALDWMTIAHRAQIATAAPSIAQNALVGCRHVQRPCPFLSAPCQRTNDRAARGRCLAASLPSLYLPSSPPSEHGHNMT